MKYFIYILIFVLLSGCVSRRACDRKYPPIQKIDSIYVYKEKLVYRDTTIFIELPGDTILKTDTVYITKEGVQSDTISSNLQYSYAAAWVLNSRLQLEHRQKDTIISRIIENAIKEKSTVETIIKTETKIEEVKFIPWWAKVLMWLSLPTIVFVFVKLIKLFI